MRVREGKIQQTNLELMISIIFGNDANPYCWLHKVTGERQ